MNENTNPSWDEQGPRLDPGQGPGQGLSPVVPEDAPQQVRMWSTARLQGLVQSLEPYVNGTLGEVSPRHAQVYLSAVREMSKLWSAAWIPPPPQPEPEPEQDQVTERAGMVRARVLAQLEELRSRTATDGHG